MSTPATATNSPAQVNHAARAVRSAYQPFAITQNIVAADTAAAVVLLAAKTGYTHYVTKITFSVTTDAAQTLLVTDGTFPVAMSKSSPGLGPITWDFGEDGTPIAAATALVFTLSAAGLAGRLFVEGYSRLTVVGAP